jgi:methionine synthase II (cobalamin-independent)
MVVVTNAHLVGSINQPDAESVMRIVAEHLGERVKRIPDGEVGERFYWIQFQTFRLDETPGLVRVGEELPYKIRGIFDLRLFALDGSVAPADLRFPNLGYADAAIESYARFAELRKQGVIATGVRFQVSIPTPVGVIGAFIVPDDRASIEQVYEKALFGEVARIAEAIPHEDLAIQWDAAVEFGILDRVEYEGVPFSAGWEGDLLGGVVERATRQIAAVPEDVQVGFHLCYGDVEEEHFIQPKDTGTLASVIKGIVAVAPRTVSWFHLPVPIERDDVAYFAPLAGLNLPVDTGVELGLIHHEDGFEGAERRIAAASTVLDRFGVGTECGFGRGPAERTAPLLDLHAAIVDAHR